FFVQAEDGIRDFHVTGVQTCALPIYRPMASATRLIDAVGEVENAEIEPPRAGIDIAADKAEQDAQRHHDQPLEDRAAGHVTGGRSEERRVGKESSTGRVPVDYNNQCR